MNITRRNVIGLAAVSAGVISMRGRAQGGPTIKIGVLTDLSNYLKDVAGPTAVACARQAVEDFNGSGKNINVEILVADHRHKADIGAGIARAWYDQDGVSAIVEGSNSAVALAVAGVAKEKDKIFIASGAGTSELTGDRCSPNTIHWTYDSYMTAKSTATALVRAGGTSWFFITVDYAFGHSLTNDASSFITAMGSRVLGNAFYPPLGTADFSSYLLQAQSSGAKVVGLSSAGADTINQIKQAKEFGLTQAGIKLSGLGVFINDIHAIGLEAAQGLVVTNTFYWDANDRTRAFSQRLKPKAPTVRPTMVQAGVYASTLHYLKTVYDMGVSEAQKSGTATISRMKAIPTDDDPFGTGKIRADGRVLHPSYLWEVKSPAESKAPWDYYKLLATTSADEAFRPMLGACNFVSS